jgi:hypothetical protein
VEEVVLVVEVGRRRRRWLWWRWLCWLRWLWQQQGHDEKQLQHLDFRHLDAKNKASKRLPPCRLAAETRPHGLHGPPLTSCLKSASTFQASGTKPTRAGPRV